MSDSFVMLFTGFQTQEGKIDVLFLVQGNERYKSWGPQELDTFLVDYELERRQEIIY